MSLYLPMIKPNHIFVLLKQASCRVGAHASKH